MKVYLMHRDRDFDLEQNLPPLAAALAQDLELTTLFKAMARGDDLLFKVATSAVITSLRDEDSILYRQHILQDCLKHPAVVRHIYDIATESITEYRRRFWGWKYPSSILSGSVEAVKTFMVMLRKLRDIATEHADQFESEGFSALFAMLIEELRDDYFATVQHHLHELSFPNGVPVSAKLGQGNKGTTHVLRKQSGQDQSLFTRLFFGEGRPSFTVHVHPRDEAGSRALSELRDRGINPVANALAQSSDHILDFFKALRTEVAFYVGCLNLHDELEARACNTSFPVPASLDVRQHTCTGLYDVCLALTIQEPVVSNDVSADKKELVMITGANQGGKSTFLRSIGVAQLMMQSGMFVSAQAFCANICERLITHFKREEDSTMKSGKFDEELSRMSDIVDEIGPNCILLCNESFAATNEREGSEIARQIVCALLERRITIFYVTHLFELAHGFYEKAMENALFLRAERQAGGGRTFRLVEAEPLKTSHGADLYRRIFAQDIGAPAKEVGDGRSPELKHPELKH